MARSNGPSGGTGESGDLGPMANIGPYKPLRRLGRGGMGTVYLARHPDRGELVAVKVIRADLADDPEFRARFLREARAARKVPRRYTAEVIGGDVDGNQPYLVTEYVRGPTLADEVAQAGPLPPAELERLGWHMAAALADIHAAGIAHCDLKPNNILLSHFGPRVIDFGIARASDDAVTFSGVGTPAFMAPEQASLDGVTTKADIHAWGAVMVFAATGEAPFGVASIPELMRRVLDEVPDLSGLDAALRPIVAAALAKDPDQRPTADQLLTRLDAFRFYALEPYARPPDPLPPDPLPPDPLPPDPLPPDPRAGEPAGDGSGTEAAARAGSAEPGTPRGSSPSSPSPDTAMWAELPRLVRDAIPDDLARAEQVWADWSARGLIDTAARDFLLDALVHSAAAAIWGSGPRSERGSSQPSTLPGAAAAASRLVALAAATLGTDAARRVLVGACRPPAQGGRPRQRPGSARPGSDAAAARFLRDQREVAGRWRPDAPGQVTAFVGAGPHSLPDGLREVLREAVAGAPPAVPIEVLRLAVEAHQRSGPDQRGAPGEVLDWLHTFAPLITGRTDLIAFARAAGWRPRPDGARPYEVTHRPGAGRAGLSVDLALAVEPYGDGCLLALLDVAAVGRALTVATVVPLLDRRADRMFAPSDDQRWVSVLHAAAPGTPAEEARADLWLLTLGSLPRRPAVEVFAPAPFEPAAGSEEEAYVDAFRAALAPARRRSGGSEDAVQVAVGLEAWLASSFPLAGRGGAAAGPSDQLARLAYEVATADDRVAENPAVVALAGRMAGLLGVGSGQRAAGGTPWRDQWLKLLRRRYPQVASRAVDAALRSSSAAMSTESVADAFRAAVDSGLNVGAGLRALAESPWRLRPDRAFALLDQVEWRLERNGGQPGPLLAEGLAFLTDGCLDDRFAAAMSLWIRDEMPPTALVAAAALTALGPAGLSAEQLGWAARAYECLDRLRPLGGRGPHRPGRAGGDRASYGPPVPAGSAHTVSVSRAAPARRTGRGAGTAERMAALAVEAVGRDDLAGRAAGALEPFLAGADPETIIAFLAQVEVRTRGSVPVGVAAAGAVTPTVVGAILAGGFGDGPRRRLADWIVWAPRRLWAQTVALGAVPWPDSAGRDDLDRLAGRLRPFAAYSAPWPGAGTDAAAPGRGGGRRRWRRRGPES